MIDWSACPAVERSADTLSGAWRFKNTRVPIKALFENLESGATVDQFLEWFPGVTKQQALVVLETAARLTTDNADYRDSTIAEVAHRSKFDSREY
jgi:uncharacterized protein (DUF433 family)